MNELPKVNKSDLLLSSAKGLVSIVPVVGGLLSEIVDAGLRPRLTTGINLWMAEITEKIEQLEQKNGSQIIKNLSSDEEFISILLEASNRAVKTHKENRRVLLRNMVVNSLVGEYEFDKKMLFFNILDQLSEYQLKMLFLIKANQDKIQLEQAMYYNDTEKYVQEFSMPEDPTLALYLFSQLEDMELLGGRVYKDRNYMILSKHGLEFYNFTMEAE